MLINQVLNTFKEGNFFNWISNQIFAPVCQCMIYDNLIAKKVFKHEMVAAFFYCLFFKKI